MDINQQNVVITGAASGMGAETARQLKKAGAKKIILLDIHQTQLNKIADEIDGIGLVCDVTSAENVENVFQQIKERVGECRICINCAGIAPGMRILRKDEGAMPLDEFKKVIDINLTGTFNVLRIAAEYMSQCEPLAEDERGVIINTASIAAYEGQIGQAAYSASKAGIIGMTLPAARELARYGIRVMTIAPGLINTPMLAGMPKKIQEALQAQTLFPKRLGEAAEFAALVLHIIQNKMLNGSIIRLDGAIRLQA